MDSLNSVLRVKIESALDGIEDLRMICARLEAGFTAGNVNYLEKIREFSESLENFNNLNEDFTRLGIQLALQAEDSQQRLERETQLERSIQSIEDHLLSLEKNRRRIRNDGIIIALTITLLMIALIIHMVLSG